jgi:hypothetical protein
MAPRIPPRKVTYFEPVPPRLARNTIIESTFEVGRRFRCTMRIDCGELDPAAVIRPIRAKASFWQHRGRKVRFEAPDQSPVSVLPVPASKPATGTAAEISVPSIEKTRPCEADSRIFNTA